MLKNVKITDITEIMIHKHVSHVVQVAKNVQDHLRVMFVFQTIYIKGNVLNIVLKLVHFQILMLISYEFVMFAMKIVNNVLAA